MLDAILRHPFSALVLFDHDGPYRLSFSCPSFGSCRFECFLDASLDLSRALGRWDLDKPFARAVRHEVSWWQDFDEIDRLYPVKHVVVVNFASDLFVHDFVGVDDASLMGNGRRLRHNGLRVLCPSQRVLLDLYRAMAVFSALAINFAGLNLPVTDLLLIREVSICYSFRVGIIRRSDVYRLGIGRDSLCGSVSIVARLLIRFCMMTVQCQFIQACSDLRLLPVGCWWSGCLFCGMAVSKLLQDGHGEQCVRAISTTRCS